MVFPKSNLSTAAQPWGRFVEKSITNLETTVATERVNNAARDAQASLSIKRLDQSVTAVAAATVAAQQAADDAAAAATTAQAAIDGLGELDQSTSTYKINADNLVAGTITGITIQSGTVGTRVEMNAENLSFYNTNGYVGKINGGTNFANDELSMNNADETAAVYVDDTTAVVRANNGLTGSAERYGSFGVSYTGNGGAFLLTPGVTWDFNGLTNNTTAATGNLTLTGAFTGNGSASIGGNLSTDGSLTRTVLATGASTTCTINGSGQFVRTTSSARYKQDIQPLEVNYDELLSLEPKRFRLKEEAETNSDARFYAGFIAEEIDQTSLKDFVGYSKQEDGSVIPESVYYAEMAAALLAGLKHQDAMIKELQAQVAELQSKVQ